VTWDDTTDYNGAGTDSDIFYKFWNGTSWSSTEVISTESTLNSVRPSIAVDSADNIHVTWDDTTDYNGAGTDSDVFYKRWTGIWSSTEVISTESTSFSASPSIAVDSADNIHVVYYDSTDYNGAGGDVDIFYKSWTGTSWSSTEVISTESTSDSLVPSIAVDSADNIHIAWHDNTNYNGAGTENDIFYKFWDGAWSPVEVISTESTSDSSDPIIVIDSADFIHVIWHDQTDYNGAGTDFDIFYKVLSGPPEIPVLNPIVPNPNGIVDLNWAETYATSSYSVYRDVYPIHSIEGLTPIAETEAIYFVDMVNESDFYYYVITANNKVGSSISNMQYVEVDIGAVPTTTVTEEITTTEETTITDPPVTITNPGATATETESVTLTITDERTKTVGNMTETITDTAGLPFNILAVIFAFSVGVINYRRKRRID